MKYLKQIKLKYPLEKTDIDIIIDPKCKGFFFLYTFLSLTDDFVLI